MALYAFDGTWNIRDQKNTIEHIQDVQYGPDQAPKRDTAETNVHRFKEFYGSKVEYLQGVGTRFGYLGRIFGGAFGFGGRHRIRKMYRRLSERYFAGDPEIDIIGFSRGAALAVHFANIVASHGLRNPANKRHLAWWYYPDLGWTYRHPKPSESDVKAPAIDFLGLWDCVASFGIPVWPFRNRSKKWQVWTLPNCVKFSFHAMALDEVRASFALIRPRDDAQRPTPHYEVWFRGVHANIGGGYLDRGLSDIALSWMMEQAIWSWRFLGRTIPKDFEIAVQLLEPESMRALTWAGSNLETLEPNPNGIIGRPIDLVRQAWRKLPENALIHHSVFRRDKNLISDHYSANRQLLRRIPENARQVFDPPLFFNDTLHHAARQLAVEIFARVPVRPQSWLTLNQNFIFRSDNWIALGTKLGRDGPALERGSREAFIRVTIDWILNGRPRNPSILKLTQDLPDEKGNTIDNPDQTKVWVISVLLQLERYFPWKPELLKLK